MKFWQEVDGLLLRQAAKQSDAVRDAIVRSVPVEDIVNRWAEAHPTEGTIMPADARAWAQMNAIIPVKPLADVLDHVHAVGWVLGDDASTAAFGRAAQGIDKAAPSDKALKVAIRTDWSKWKPGSKPASLLVRPPGAFAALLEQGRASVKGINATIADRIGTVLADSLNSGDTYTTLSKKFLADTITSKVVKNPLHAEMIAVTEMSRAFNASTVNNYTEFGVELVEWLAIDVGTCPICPANAAQGPIPLGQPFQSGETAPPAHPHCRCTLIPVVDEGKPMTDEEFAQALIGGSPAPVAAAPINDVAAAAIKPGVADLPKLDDIFDSRGMVAYDKMSEVYGSRDFNGFRVEVKETNVFKEKTRDVIKVQGRILAPDGSYAGSVHRTFTRDTAGKLAVDHELLTLGKDYRGQGFGRVFSEFSETYYRANNVSEIEIFAALDNGGYVWAKAGYEFDAQPYKVIDRISEKITTLANAADNRVHLRLFEGQMTAEEAKALADRLAALESSLRSGVYSDAGYPKPFDIANMEGPELFGKSFGRWLLDGTSWVGVKKL